MGGAFQPVDGAEGRACRGASSRDNLPDYYAVRSGVPSLDECKGLCLVTTGCVGIEHNVAVQRCEIWTRSAGIQASVAVAGYVCYSYARTATTSTTTMMGGAFQPVDGAEGRACRGASSRDNLPDYYAVRSGVPSLDECKGLCLVTTGCVGIEHNVAVQRCEIWTRSAGIQASVAVAGYVCYRRTAGADCKAQFPEAGATAEACNRICSILPTSQWPCSGDGPCLCSGGAAEDSLMEFSRIHEGVRPRLRGHHSRDHTSGVLWIQHDANIMQARLEF